MRRRIDVDTTLFRRHIPAGHTTPRCIDLRPSKLIVERFGLFDNIKHIAQGFPISDRFSPIHLPVEKKKKRL